MRKQMEHAKTYLMLTMLFLMGCESSPEIRYQKVGVPPSLLEETPLPNVEDVKDRVDLSIYTNELAIYAVNRRDQIRSIRKWNDGN